MKITNTTVFRLALRFAIIFELITVTALLSVYFTTLIELQDQTDSELWHEIDELDAAYQAKGIECGPDPLIFVPIINRKLHYE